jgi:hypothetical protein
MALVSGILLITLLLWAAVLANGVTLNSSDPAGNALSQAYGVFMVIGLWVLLATLLSIAAVRGPIHSWATIAAIILVPASGAAALGAMHLMSGNSATRWPLAILVLGPALLIGYALWLYFPGLKAAIPAPGANGVVWGGLLLLSLSPWPRLAQRSRAGSEQMQRVQAAGGIEEAKQAEARRQENLAAFQKLTSSSRLWDWMPFTWDGNELRDQALEGARRSPSRQADAEEMLARGHHFPLVEVQSLNLAASPALCASANVFLIKHAGDLAKVAPDLPDYDARSAEFETYIGPIAWLNANGCDLAAALDALEASARTFGPSPRRQLYLESLARLRPR